MLPNPFENPSKLEKHITEMRSLVHTSGESTSLLLLAAILPSYIELSRLIIENLKGIPHTDLKDLGLGEFPGLARALIESSSILNLPLPAKILAPEKIRRRKRTEIVIQAINGVEISVIGHYENGRRIPKMSANFVMGDEGDKLPKNFNIISDHALKITFKTRTKQDEIYFDVCFNYQGKTKNKKISLSIE